MKVGTDGVLLGAWTILNNRRTIDSVAEQKPQEMRVLDVGAGCGLVSLMVAQRYPNAVITALELDTEAAKQAKENVASSPFTKQVNVEEGDFLLYDEEKLFDAIVSNPPFFEETLLPPDSVRASARHTSAGLTFEALITHSVKLLKAEGSLQVIIPKDAQTRFHTLCNMHDLTLIRATDVRTVERKSPKRVLLHFVKSINVSTPVTRDEVILMRDGNRSEEYTRLCQDFYL